MLPELDPQVSSMARWTAPHLGVISGYERLASPAGGLLRRETPIPSAIAPEQTEQTRRRACSTDVWADGRRVSLSVSPAFLTLLAVVVGVAGGNYWFLLRGLGSGLALTSAPGRGPFVDGANSTHRVRGCDQCLCHIPKRPPEPLHYSSEVRQPPQGHASLSCLASAPERPI